MDFFVGTLLILGAWVLLSLIFVSVGWAVQLLFELVTDRSGLTMRAFWLGWGTIVALLQVWHLFWPVNWQPYVLIAILAGMVALLARARLQRPFRVTPGPLLLLLLVAPALAYLALGTVGSWDAGLYHLASIKWALHYPAVPGLGNLHGRLAFNSSYFLYQAFLDWFPVAAGYNLAAGLLGVALFTELLLRAKKQDSHIVPRALAWLLIGPSLYLAVRHASSTSPDWPVFVLGSLVGLHTADLLYREYSTREQWSHILFIIFLVALGITIKLSFAALGLLFVGVAILFVLHKQWKRSAWPIARQVAFLVVPLLLLLGWILHGYIISGYPAYPSTVGRINFSWTVSSTAVVEEAKWVSSWARWPGRDYKEVEALGQWAWLTPWLRRTSRNIGLFTLPMLGVAAGIFLSGILYHRASTLERRQALILLLPLAGATAFWFMAAPDPRLAGATLYLLAAVLVALGCSQLPAGWRRLMLLLFTLPWLFFTMRLGWHQAEMTTTPFAPPPTVELEHSPISANVTIWSPVDGNRCWDAPLLCRPPAAIDGTLLWHPPEEGQWGFRVVEQHEEAQKLNTK